MSQKSLDAHLGALFRAAEELELTRADVDALQRRRPDYYAPLTYWRAVDERPSRDTRAPVDGVGRIGRVLDRLVTTKVLDRWRDLGLAGVTTARCLHGIPLREPCAGCAAIGPSAGEPEQP